MNQHQPAKTFAGGRRELSMYSFARNNDVQENVAKMLLAFIDIYHGYIEQTTPKYNCYKLQRSNGQPLHTLLPIVQSVQPPQLGVLFGKCISLKQTWAHFDVDGILRSSGGKLTREEVVYGITQIESNGTVTVRAEGVVHCYKIKKVPVDIQAVAAEEYNRFRLRETRELARLAQVLTLIGANECQSKLLLIHFGEKSKGEKWTWVVQNAEGA